MIRPSPLLERTRAFARICRCVPSPMPSPIEWLPVEIFDVITVDLDLPAYQALRLTSRRLHLLSLSSFARKYFSELVTTLGSPSLDRLVNICRHRYLSSAVALLDIKLLNHEDYKALTKVSRIGTWPPPKRFSRMPAVKREHISGESTFYIEVFSSDYPDCIVDRLVRSLKGFRNLKAIRFRTYNLEPFEWRATTMPLSDQLFRTRCFQAVLDAIIKSEVDLQEFSMAKVKKSAISKCADIPHPTMLLSARHLGRLRSRFSNLTTLTLSIVAGCDGDARTPGWENGLGKLIATAPNLKHLALSLDRNCRVSRYSATVLHSLALSCRLSKLNEFQLYNCLIHEEDLMIFVNAHSASLSKLVFADIHLLTGSWHSLWVALKTLGKLQCLRLATLEGTNSPVMFRGRVKERFKTTLNARKSGRPMTDMLDSLIASCDEQKDTSIASADAN